MMDSIRGAPTNWIAKIRYSVHRDMNELSTVRPSPQPSPWEGEGVGDSVCAMAGRNRDKSHRVAPVMTDRGRSLRQKAPVPERILWGMLRGRRLGGLKFRRQVPIGPYVADFYCADARLIVELDGLSHFGRAEHDQRRTTYLESQGLTVFRVTNDDLLADATVVGEYILREARRRTSHKPSPSQGEGSE